MRRFLILLAISTLLSGAILSASLYYWMSDGPAPSRIFPSICGISPTLWDNPILNETFDKVAFTERARVQAMELKAETVFSKFKFTDVSERTGIRFRHRSTRDTLKYVRANQYDHIGTVATADVDNNGYPDLFFTTLVGENELWLNENGKRFRMSPSAQTLAMRNQTSAGASFADFNGDGKPDLIVTTIRQGIRYFENQGNGEFKDKTKDSALDRLEKRHSSVATIFDFNNDGALDVYISNIGVFTTPHMAPEGNFEALEDAVDGFKHPERSERPFVLFGDGHGRFKDTGVSARFPATLWNGDAAFSDINSDGFLDLYMLNMNGPDRFYINDQGRGWKDEGAKFFSRTPWGAMGAKFLDFDGDGSLELLVSDMHSDMWGDGIAAGEFKRERLKFPEDEARKWYTHFEQSIYGNALLRLETDGSYKDISNETGFESYWPWGISAGDLNADGFTDVILTAGMGFPFRYGGNTLKLNVEGQKFVDAEFELNVEPRRIKEEVVFTLECVGTDRFHPRCIFCRNPAASPECLEKNQQGELKVRAATSDRGSAIIDLDGDGDLDLVFSPYNGSARILENNLSDVKEFNWLQIALPSQSLGAVVELKLSNGRRLVQQHDGKLGYLAQSSAPLHFLFGKDASVTEVGIRWPGQSKFEKVELGNNLLSKRHEIRQNK